MKSSPAKPLHCVICGMQSDQHARWFLVIENTWLDRIKILSWHPVLAEQDEMKSVCGKRHLHILITHWLTYANLDFVRSRTPEFALACNETASDGDHEFRHGGQFVGELAVHRESLSRLWAGSPEECESIFQALIGGLEARQSPPVESPALASDFPINEWIEIPKLVNEYFGDYAMQ